MSESGGSHSSVVVTRHNLTGGQPRVNARTHATPSKTQAQRTMKKEAAGCMGVGSGATYGFRIHSPLFSSFIQFIHIHIPFTNAIYHLPVLLYTYACMHARTHARKTPPILKSILIIIIEARIYTLNASYLLTFTYSDSIPPPLFLFNYFYLYLYMHIYTSSLPSPLSFRHFGWLGERYGLSSWPHNRRPSGAMYPDNW